MARKVGGNAFSVYIEDLLTSIDKGGHKSIERFLRESLPYTLYSGEDVIALNGTK